MKLTKSKLKQVIREEIQKMNEAKTYADAMAGTNIDVSSKGITSLEGAPKEVEGDFYCQKNKTKFTEEDVRAVCKVGGRILV